MDLAPRFLPSLGLLLVGGILVACAGAGGMSPVTASEWKAVTAEWLTTGDISAQRSCPVVVVARSHVTRNKGGEALALALNKFERLRCVTDGDPWTIARGMSNREVVTRAGAPVPWLSGPNCWYYRKARANTNIVGRTICFDRRGYVVDIDTALHL